MSVFWQSKGMSEVQFSITRRPQLFEFEVASFRTCSLRSKKLPRLICKNDEALRKAGVLACRFDTSLSPTYHRYGG